MGINVRLEDERGNPLEQILDERNILSRAIPPLDDPRFPWTSTIDLYGDTTFNKYQAERVREEWRLLIENAKSEAARAFLSQVDELLARCASTVHLYVKFIGD